MSMNTELANYYNTLGEQPVEEDLAKQASVEEFAKLAAQHGIDLSTMSNEEIDSLYAETYPQFAKTAMEEDKDEDDEDDEDEDKKKESAAHYLQEKRAFQEKFAEADFMGRVMAHSFVQERDAIEKAAAGGTQALGVMRTGTKTLMRRAAKKGATGKQARNLLKGQAKKGLKGMAKAHGGKAGAGAAGAAAGGLAGYLAGKKKESSAQAFEELAANYGIKLASENGYDADEVFNRVNAVYTLGLDESEKIAAVQTDDQAIHVRGLEYLEAAGVPVNWDEVFGG